MAISVAPLTTTVMGSVPEDEAGVASGVNNAVARTAGLLAIAVLGVVMLQVFSRQLERRLAGIDIPESTRSALYQQRIKLGGIDINEVAAEGRGPQPGGAVGVERSTPVLSDTEKQALRQAVKSSFVSGFRVIMLISAAMALAAALITSLMFENKKAPSEPPAVAGG